MLRITQMRIQTLLLASVILAACSTEQKQQVQNITGAGATFPYPMYSKWFDEYGTVNPKVRINYQSLGSGAGIRQVTEGTVDFGASDQPMSEEQLTAFRQKHNSGILHLPSVLGAVVPTYNLPGVSTELNFTAEALAGIFLGKVKNWNDPAISSANPGVKLPADEITVVHRSDGSGTTFIWTDYLAKTSPEWSAGPGRAASISWPTGVGGKGNEGVAGLVKETPNSLGYVEMIYAVQNKMSVGKVRNSSGKFVAASLESVTAAADGVNMPDDFRVSITNPPGPAAYPISSFTWLLIPEKIEDAGKRQGIYDFLDWMLGPGQGMTSVLQYAPLPASVIEKEKKVLAALR
jgi:phosphate transport system substrate-binding protein